MPVLRAAADIESPGTPLAASSKSPVLNPLANVRAPWSVTVIFAPSRSASVSGEGLTVAAAPSIVTEDVASLAADAPSEFFARTWNS